MRRVATIFLLALLVAPPAIADAELPTVSAEPVFVMRDGAPTEDWPAHPGEVVGLALGWPEDTRPAAPGLGTLDEETSFALLPLRLVPSDPRAGGRDVIEVLPVVLGSAELPQLPLIDGDGEARARLGALTLEIGAALAESDTEPAPARGPVALGLDPVGLAIAALAAMLALGLALFAWRRWAPARRGPADHAPEPERLLSPREKALEEIAALLESGMHRKGDQKAFGVALAEIGKDYFAGTHEVALRERTSWECTPLLRRAGCPEDAIRWLEGWLGRIDLVKFAGARPAADELEALADALRSRVEATP